MPVEKKRANQTNPWDDLFRDILNNKLTVILFVVASAIAGVLVAQYTRPVYEANALIQVKTRSNSVAAMFGDIGSFLGMGGGSAETEIQLMQSRRILEEVVDSLGLQNNAEPLGIVDRFLHREGRVDIRYLYFPDTSVMPSDRRGEPWTLVVDDSAKFSFYDDLDQKVLTCELGRLCAVPYQGDSVKIQVSLMNVRPGQKFEVTQTLLIRAINAVIGNLTISEQGKKTGILSVAYQDYHLERAKWVVDTLTAIYLRVNEEFASTDMKNSLQLLEDQLPEARRVLDSLMDALSAYRESKGSADIETETKIALESRLRLQQKVIELEQLREEKARLFDRSHPFIVTTDKQISALKKEIARSDDETKKLPEAQRKILTMTAEAQFAQNIYADLLKRIEQMRLLVAGVSESAQIIDAPDGNPKPVKPKKKMIVAVFLFMGLCGALAFISVRKKWRGVTDPVALSKETGARVYAWILNGEQKAQDGLDMLRLSLDLDAAGTSRVICFTGLLPGVGCSFVARRTAELFAKEGKKVLLIDADLQQGGLSKFFKTEQNSGLVDVLAGTSSLQAAVCHTAISGLDLLPSGRLLLCAESVFDTEKFKNFLLLARDGYDVVIVDSQSLQNSMDASVLGQNADEIVLVLEYGRHKINDVQESLSLLSKATRPLKVMAFNKCENPIYINKTGSNK